MSKLKHIPADGTVWKVLPDRRFDVRLANGESVLATLAGRFRRDAGRLLEGDHVRLELSPYDLTRGRIVGRAV